MIQSAVVITPTRILCRLCTDVAVNRPRRICNDCLALETARAFAEDIPESEHRQVVHELQLKQAELLADILSKEGENGREEEGNEERQGRGSGRPAPSGDPEQG